jgi:hypothetical protein
LPVPQGIVILDGAWQRLQEWGALTVDGDDIHVTNAAFFLEALALHKVKRPVVVRPAFVSDEGVLSAEAHDQTALAPDEPEQLIHALIAVWQSGASWATRRDMLVMEFVHADVKGSAVLGHGDSADTITFTHSQTGTTDTIDLPQLVGRRRPDAIEPFARRLQQLLRGVRRSFGDGKVAHIEWIDDGKICHLVGLSSSVS